jgi:hypothetical protein
MSAPVLEMPMSAPSGLLDDESTREEIGLPYPQVIRTADAYEAKERTQEFLRCSHRMTVLERDASFLARVQYRSICGLGLMTSAYGSSVEIGCSPPIPLVTVNFVLGGKMLIEDGDTTTVADDDHAAAFCFDHDST